MDIDSLRATERAMLVKFNNQAKRLMAADPTLSIGVAPGRAILAFCAAITD